MKEFASLAKIATETGKSYIFPARSNYFWEERNFTKILSWLKNHYVRNNDATSKIHMFKKITKKLKKHVILTLESYSTVPELKFQILSKYLFGFSVPHWKAWLEANVWKPNAPFLLQMILFL